MTALTSMLRIASYRDALRDALRRAVEGELDFPSALSGEASLPDGLSRDDWSAVVGSIRVAYEISRRESVEGVINDVADTFQWSEGEPELVALASALKENPQAERIIDGARRRDALLPNVLGVDVSIDLRVVSDASSDAIDVAPIAVVRINFDEHVAGQDAVFFQVPVGRLRELAESFTSAADLARRAVDSPSALNVPTWAANIEGDE